MIKHYILAIGKGSTMAMYNLGFYYKEIKDYDNMIKYYEMVSKKGHVKAKKELEKFLNNNKKYKTKSNKTKSNKTKSNKTKSTKIYIDICNEKIKIDI